MKQRIIAVILLIVMAVTTLVGCGNYAFLEDGTIGEYATVDWDALLDALGKIEIEEEDFGPEEDREEIVKREIYNTILTSLKSDDKNRLTDGKIGEYDMVEYFYYCSYNGYTFDYNMKSAVNTLTTSSSTDEQKDVKKGIVEALAEANYTLVEDGFYKLKTSLENERIGENDTIVVSYKLKTKTGENTYTLATYANKTIDKNHELFGKLRDLYVGIETYKEEIEIGDNTYSSVTVSGIVENAGTAFEAYKYTTEDETEKTAYDSTGKQVTVTVPEDAQIQYHVYPVARIAAPEITAETVVRYALGRNIGVDSLPVFANDGVKAKVEALAAEYAKTDYTADDEVKAALEKLQAERKEARVEVIENAIAKLEKAENSKGEYADDAILSHYNDKNGTTYATITELFKALSDNYTKKIPVNGLLGDIYVDSLAALMGYKYSGSTALALLNAVNDEIVRESDLAKDDDYEELSYYDNSTSDVKDAKEKYLEAIDTAEQKAVDVLVKDLVSAAGEDTIVDQYKEKVDEITFAFSPYNLILNVLLSSSATSSTFSFIDDINDYLYSEAEELSGWDKFWGKDNSDENVTFADVLTDLVEVFGSSASSDYEDITTVKEALKAHEAAEDALSDYALDVKVAITNASYVAAKEKLITALNAAQKDETTAADAIKAYYNEQNSKNYEIGEIIDELSKTSYTKYESDGSKNEITYRKTITYSKLLGTTGALKDYKNESGTTAYSSVETFNSALNASLSYSAVSAYSSLLSDCEKDDTNAFDALAKLYIAKHPDTVFVMSKGDDAPANQKKVSDNKTTVLSAIVDDAANKDEYIAALEGFAFYTDTENTDNSITAKDLFEYLCEVCALTEAHTESEENYEAAQNAARQEKLDYAVAKLLSCYHEDEDGKVTTVSGELALRYFNNTISTKINTYNTNVQEKLAKEIYSIIWKNTTVTGYPEDLLDKYVESIRNGYENEFYTGTSDIYSAGTPAEGLTQALKEAKEAYEATVKEAEEAITSGDNGMSDAYSAYLTVVVLLGDNDRTLTELEKAYYAAYTAYNEKDAALDLAEDKLDDAEDALDDANEKLEAIKSSDELGFFNKIGAIFDANKDVSAAKKTVKSATKAKESAEEALETAQKALDKAKKNLEINTDGASNENFVEHKEAFEDAKDAYDTAKKNYNSAVSEGASNAEALKTTYLDKAVAYRDAAVNYYASSAKVSEVATSALSEAETAFINVAKDRWYDSKSDFYDKDFKKAYDKCDDTDEKIDLINSKYTEAETDTAGEKLSNYLAYGSFENYLKNTLGYNYEDRIKEEAKTALESQIKVYAVAKAFVDNGYATKYADEIKANEATFRAIYEYSVKNSDEDISDRKLEKKVDEYYEELLESADSILVTDKVFKDYKKELGSANYDYYEQNYGEDNLRMNLQFSNLFGFLLFTTYEENPYGEGYVIKDYKFVTFTFTEAED